MGIYPAMRDSDIDFETLLYDNFDRTLTHTSCSPGMAPKTYPAYEEEYRVNTIERRFQQLLLNVLMYGDATSYRCGTPFTTLLAQWRVPFG